MPAYIVDAVRTHVGKYGGVLSAIRPDDLAAATINSLVQRNSIDSRAIDEVILGAANQAGEDNRNVARMSSLLAGLPVEVPAYTVNRLCASGLQAVASAADAINTGRCDIVIAGGVESMTRSPWVQEKPPKAWGKPGKIFDTALGWRLINPLMALHDKGRTTLSLGEATEVLAKEYGISREECDEFSFRSHQLATSAWESGFFGDEIVRLSGSESILVDETIRDTTIDSLAQLKSSFSKNGVVTAGNASPLSDGASAVLVVSDAAVKKYGMKPRAEILGFDVAGVAPYQFGIGPVPATLKLAKRLNLSVSDFEAIELNEAFAAQSLACIKLLSLDINRINNRGGAIALGHPLGSSGARILGTLLKRLETDNLSLGLATLCIGVGQGAAMAIKRI